jgi:chemotaxis signal transduction protein
VSAPGPGLGGSERLLTFDVGGRVYALPIAWVVEVGEVETLSCIPTLPRSVAGVMNHHGDALPVLTRSVLLEIDETRLPAPSHVLVLSSRPAGGARLGLPVDRVLGLVDGHAAVSRDADPVAERRTLGPRVVWVLDPQRLVERAQAAIERTLARGE